MERFLREAFYALLHLPGSTLLDVSMVLSSKSNESVQLQKEILQAVDGEEPRQFWDHDFEQYRKDDLGPPKNKLSKLLVGGTVALMLSQPESAFNFRKIMDDLAGYRRHGSRWAGNSIPDALPGTDRHGAYTPIETGYVAQERGHEPPAAAERQSVYDPLHSFYDGHRAEYETPEPWHESVIGKTPPIRFSPTDADGLRPPEYDDALIDEGLMARALNDLVEPRGTLDEKVHTTINPAGPLHDAESDLRAARIDPLVTQTFRRLCDRSIDDLDEDELFPAAAVLRLFAPRGTPGPGPGPLF